MHHFHRFHHLHDFPYVLLLGVVLIGLATGAVAILIGGGKRQGGCTVPLLLGIAGAGVGSFFGKMLGDFVHLRFTGYIGACGGAIVLLLIYQFVSAKKP
jgi:uncharacterized membrane protein YeaQ/YmgE (transglycosylase-associated protein family)